MCYSKEVQLVTGATILIFSVFYYVLYSIKYHALKKKWLIPFLRYVLLGFVFAGLHQIFEFLSLVTNSQIIYKIGLTFSMFIMYFFLRSLEVLLNRNLKSKLALVFIGITVLHIFLVEMYFEPFSFYLKHNSTFIWSCVWMLIFCYFHICALKGRKLLKNDLAKKAILTYLLATLDISFLLSLIYVLWGYFQFSVNVCTDAPSIWCTFYVIQIFALPTFLSTVPMIIEQPKQRTIQNIKDTFLYLLLALLLVILMASTLTFFDCLTVKYVFP